LTFRRVAGRPPLSRMDFAACRPGKRREQCPVRPVQRRAVLRLALQDGDLVAQDQDLRGPLRLLALGQPQPCGYSRDQKENEPQAYDR
jgi:hypothetical protein